MSAPNPAALRTPWSASFGLKVPILNAPMGGAAGGRLAVAVSSAGGLGMIGIGSAGSVELLEREASIPRAAGVRYGIGLLAWAIERDPELLACAINAGPDLIAVSFGAPEGWPAASAMQGSRPPPRCVGRPAAAPISSEPWFPRKEEPALARFQHTPAAAPGEKQRSDRKTRDRRFAAVGATANCLGVSQSTAGQLAAGRSSGTAALAMRLQAS